MAVETSRVCPFSVSQKPAIWRVFVLMTQAEKSHAQTHTAALQPNGRTVTLPVVGYASCIIPVQPQISE
jgi:hypothetical protein